MSDFMSHKFGEVEVWNNDWREWVVRRGQENADWRFDSPGKAILFANMCSKLSDDQWLSARLEASVVLNEWFPKERTAAE